MRNLNFHVGIFEIHIIIVRNQFLFVFYFLDLLLFIRRRRWHNPKIFSFVRLWIVTWGSIHHVRMLDYNLLRKNVVFNFKFLGELLGILLSFLQKLLIVIF